MKPWRITRYGPGDPETWSSYIRARDPQNDVDCDGECAICDGKAECDQFEDEATGEDA